MAKEIDSLYNLAKYTLSDLVKYPINLNKFHLPRTLREDILKGIMTVSHEKCLNRWFRCTPRTHVLYYIDFDHERAYIEIKNRLAHRLYFIFGDNDSDEIPCHCHEVGVACQFVVARESCLERSSTYLNSWIKRRYIDRLCSCTDLIIISLTFSSRVRSELKNAFHAVYRDRNWIPYPRAYGEYHLQTLNEWFCADKGGTKALWYWSNIHSEWSEGQLFRDIVHFIPERSQFFHMRKPRTDYEYIKKHHYIIVDCFGRVQNKEYLRRCILQAMNNLKTKANRIIFLADMHPEYLLRKNWTDDFISVCNPLRTAILYWYNLLN